MELYEQLKQFKKKAKKIPRVTGGVLIRNKSGTTRGALYLTHENRKKPVWWIVTDERALALFYHATTVEQAACSFEEFIEAGWFREGIQIEERKIQTLYHEDFWYLYHQGVVTSNQQKGSVLLPTYTEFSYMGDGDIVTGDNREYAEKVMRIILANQNLSILLEAIQQGAAKGEVPIVTYNQRTALCTFDETFEPVMDLTAEEDLRPFLTKAPDELAISEFEARRAYREVKKSQPHVYEMKIGLVPSDVAVKIQPMYPFFLQVAAGGHLYLKAFDIDEEERYITFVQFQLLKICLETKTRPKKIITRGPYAQRLENLLAPITKKLGVLIERVDELIGLDHLSEIYAEQPADSDDGYIDPDEVSRMLEQLTPKQMKEVVKLINSGELSVPALVDLLRVFTTQK